MSRPSIAVVGRGMIGSAAARHLAEAGHRTTLIGAPEPADRTTWTGPMASHWDEARVTRICSIDATWAEVAARSIARYDDIETRSGIRFHAPRRFAWITPDAELAVHHAVTRGGDARVETAEWLRAETGIRAVDPDHPVCFEEAPAGLINPRRFVDAEVSLARAAGATIVDHPASTVVPTPQGVEVRGEFGRVTADRLLLATGAYGANLVGVDLNLERRLRTIVRAELGPGLELPAVIVDETGQPELFDIYWTPPVAYPDGKVALKIGGDLHEVAIAETDDELRDWFHSSGSEAEAGALEATLRRLLPDATITSTDHLPCTTVYTPGGWPFIGPVDDRVTVAVGGSGAAAKSSDELGRLAALAVGGGEWSDDALDLSVFVPTLRAA